MTVEGVVMYRAVLFVCAHIAVLLGQSTGVIAQEAEGPAGESLLGRSAVQPIPGQIVLDPDHPQWLKRDGGGHVFICGPGDPEDFLYRGRRNADGTRSGDQVELIQKLAAHGGNSIYMQVVRRHGGEAEAAR